MLFSMIVGFFTSRILLNQLGIIDFGVYNVVGSIIVIFTFLNSTLLIGTQRFINFELGRGNHENLNKVFSASVVIYVIFAILIFIVAETLGLWFLNTHMNIPQDRMTAANYVYQFTIFSTILSLNQIPYTASIIAHEHMKQYATIGIISTILHFIAVSLLFFFKTDKLILYGLMVFLMVLITSLLYKIYCNRKFKETRFKFCTEKYWYRQMLSFSGWNLFSSISMTLNGQIVGIILNIFFGPVLNAARGLTEQVSGTVRGFVSNFQVAVNPRIIQSYASGDISNFFSLIFKSAKFSFFLLLIIMLPVCIRIESLLVIWLKTVPEYTADFCRIALLASTINTFSLPLATAANANGNIKKFQLYTGIFEIMNIPLSYFFLRIGFQPIVVYFISLIIIVITLYVRLVVLKNLVNLDVSYFVRSVVFRSLITGVVAWGLSCVIANYLDSDNFFLILSYLILSIICTGLTIYIMGLDIGERQYVVNAVRKFIKK